MHKNFEAYNVDMYINKRVLSFCGVLGMTIGAAVPMLFGDYNSFDEWAVLGGFAGGVLGIVLGVWIGKRFGD